MPGPFTIEDEPTGKELWNIDASGNVRQLGDLRVNGNTTVVGTQTFTGNTAVSGNLAVTGTLAVTGASTLTGAVGLSTTITDVLAADVDAYAAISSLTNSSPFFHGRSNGAAGVLLASSVTGDAQRRFQGTVAGQMQWGDGTNPVDTTLSRTAAGVLTVTGAAVTNLLTLGGGTATATSAPVLTPTFSSGTAAQLADLTRDYMVYLTIGTAGTANTLAIGPTSTPANTLINAATATTGEMMVVRLPAGWFLKWSATTATLATQTAIGC